MNRVLERTHITLLNERCQKLGTSPAYNETTLSSPPDPPSFACECTVLGQEARGEGRTKKEAKHAAAKNMLDILMKNRSDFNPTNTNQKNTRSLPEITSCSPFANKLKGNEIGALTELCLKYDLDSPKYDPVREEGPSHDRRFTERCYVGCLGVEATDKKKKEAKQMVAHEMRSTLTNILNPRATVEYEMKAADDDDGGFASAKSKFPHSESAFVVKLHPGDLSSKIIDNPLRYRVYYDEHKDSIDRYTAEFWMNPEQKLDALLETMEIKYSLVPVSCKKGVEKKMVAITIDLSPPLNIFHFGANYDEASNKAAKTALQFLGILCTGVDDDSEVNPLTRNQFEKLVKASSHLKCLKE